MNNSIIVYGPQGCGKTYYAERIRKHFGLDKIVEDFQPHRTGIALYGVLYLTNDMRTPKIRPANTSMGMVLSFAEVAKQINDAIPLTDWQSGPPPMVGEWIAAAAPESMFEGTLRRYWKGDHWSLNYWNHEPEDEIQRCVDGRTHINADKIMWRGLAEEPIVVAV